MDEHRNCPTHRKPCQHRKEVRGNSKGEDKSGLGAWEGS